MCCTAHASRETAPAQRACELAHIRATRRPLGGRRRAPLPLCVESDRCLLAKPPAPRRAARRRRPTHARGRGGARRCSLSSHTVLGRAARAVPRGAPTLWRMLRPLPQLACASFGGGPQPSSVNRLTHANRSQSSSEGAATPRRIHLRAGKQSRASSAARARTHDPICASSVSAWWHRRVGRPSRGATGAPRNLIESWPRSVRASDAAAGCASRRTSERGSEQGTP